MTEFHNCPACRGEDALADPEGCDACGGTGTRAPSAEAFELFGQIQDWADDQVSELFATYSKITGARHGYGIEKWSICGGQVEIVVDISCRGCYDSDSHHLPVEWLYADTATRLSLIEEDIAVKKAAEEAREQERQRGRLAALKKQMADLESKISDLEDRDPESGDAGPQC